MYKHNETWRKDHNCTFCTCWNGEPKCITHYCDVKESKVKDNGTASCVKDEKFFKHEESWIDEDKCSECKCFNGECGHFVVVKNNSENIPGEITCDPKPCNENRLPKLGECQPLITCNKQCSNGFKLNKNGCEICKCNPSKLSTDQIIKKYNITYVKLLKILDGYNRSRTSNSDCSSASSTAAPTVITDTTPMQTVVLIRRNHDEGTARPETMITTTFLPEEGKCVFCAGTVL